MGIKSQFYIAAIYLLKSLKDLEEIAFATYVCQCVRVTRMRARTCVCDWLNDMMLAKRKQVTFIHPYLNHRFYIHQYCSFPFDLFTSVIP